ncbi:MAG: hypothetical protein AB7V44_11175 [Pseudonocardia sp.]
MVAPNQVECGDREDGRGVVRVSDEETRRFLQTPLREAQLRELRERRGMEGRLGGLPILSASSSSTSANSHSPVANSTLPYAVRQVV